MVMRYRASDYMVRQQIKWFAWVYALIISVGVLILIALKLLNPQRNFHGLIICVRILLISLRRCSSSATPFCATSSTTSTSSSGAH